MPKNPAIQLARASHHLLEYLGENSRTNADWPIRITVDCEETTHTLADALMELEFALIQFNENTPCLKKTKSSNRKPSKNS